MIEEYIDYYNVRRIKIKIKSSPVTYRENYPFSLSNYLISNPIFLKFYSNK
ncbi:IS3 family transposase [Vagococcus elongatus]